MVDAPNTGSQPNTGHEIGEVIMRLLMEAELPFATPGREQPARSQQWSWLRPQKAAASMDEWSACSRPFVLSPRAVGALGFQCVCAPAGCSERH